MGRTKKPKKIPKKAVMAHDPSLTGWGWVVLSLKGKVIDRGCIATKPTDKKLRIRKGDDDVRRIQEINKVILDLIAKYNIIYIASELPHGSQNAKAAQMVGTVKGLLQMLSDSKNIPLEWYSEGDAKKHAFNRQQVSKKEMITLMKKKYKNWFIEGRAKKKNEAVADALAIHYVASYQSNILKLINK